MARDAVAKGRRRRRFVAFTLGVSLVVGVTQKDAWPFAAYTLAAFPARTETPICRTEIAGVTAAGEEHRVDPYTWSPVYDSVLQYWLEQRFPLLTTDGQRVMLTFLLERAESARRRTVRGERLGFERFLGPLHARYWWMLRRSARLASDPFTVLRIYSVCWIPRERFTDATRESRRLVAEHRP